MHYCFQWTFTEYRDQGHTGLNLRPRVSSGQLAPPNARGRELNFPYQQFQRKENPWGKVQVSQRDVGKQFRSQGPRRPYLCMTWARANLSLPATAEVARLPVTYHVV